MAIVDTRQRTAIFADVQNIYYTTRQQYNRSFNYQELWNRIAAEGEIQTAYAYAIQRDNDGQFRFQQALRNIGFEVKLKPYIQRQDGSAKGDWDVGITIDVLRTAAQVDHVVLLSGDGDFDLLLHAIRHDHQVKSTVYGVPGLTAKSLVDAADVYHPIESSLLQG